MVELENKIRSKLTGGTPKALTMVLEKQAQVEGDEWGRIFQFDIQKGKLLDRAAAEAAKARQTELRGQLNRQMEELEERKRAERDDSLVHFHSEQASYQEWQVQQEVRAKLQADIVHRVAQERQEQLEEKNRRRQNVSGGREWREGVRRAQEIGRRRAPAEKYKSQRHAGGDWCGGEGRCLKPFDPAVPPSPPHTHTHTGHAACA